MLRPLGFVPQGGSSGAPAGLQGLQRCRRLDLKGPPHIPGAGPEQRSRLEENPKRRVAKETLVLQWRFGLPGILRYTPTTSPRIMVDRKSVLFT